MKNLLLCLFALLPCCIYAQPGYIFTIAGNGTSGYSGDGGPAINAQISYTGGIAVDSIGNVYFTNSNRIRKIDATTGIVTVFAGTGILGYSGDGGPAINAQLCGPGRVHFDTQGNLYVADMQNYRLRKINMSTGIITTVLGTGTPGFSPDGTLAINAHIGRISGFAISISGDIYYTDDSSKRVRKLSASSGIITTVAGNGIVGFSGDGGPAVNAQLSATDVAIDVNNNLYILDVDNFRIRKVNSSNNIINTFAGTGSIGCGMASPPGTPASIVQIDNTSTITIDCNNNLYIQNSSCFNFGSISLQSNTILNNIIYTGLGGYSGDGGPAGIARTLYLQDYALDCSGNIYIVDINNARIRKINGLSNPAYVTDSFYVYINHYCSGPQLVIVPQHYAPALTLKTWFGDGQSRTDSLNNNVSAHFDHPYQFSGTYTIKHVLYNGPTPVDSISYPYNYTYCRTLPISLYTDVNNNCSFDSTIDFLNYYPSSIEVDSNGIAIDTISATSGYNYNASGNVGDIYKFKFLSATLGNTVACPVSGIITDTLTLGMNATKKLGYHCTNLSAYDLSQFLNPYATTPSFQHGFLMLNNAYCSPSNGVETVTFSTPYVFSSASITPSAITGNSISWNVNNLSANAQPVNIDYTLSNPVPTTLLPGNTVTTTGSITPVIGDVNPANNSSTHINTVTASWDPNEMSVSPSGYIPASSTQLTYTFEFENTGNDTAQNIYVLDTISNYLDIHSLSLVAASHTMITSKVFNGTNWVMKFDFPNIKLLDSSHHNQCTGLAVFTIKTKQGLANGTVIPNRAGIYFDDNPVVLTNTVTDIIGTPSGITQVSAATVAPHIYPNPAHNELHIEGTDIHSIEVTNLLGQVVLSSHNASTTTTLNIESLQSGIYFVRVNGLYPYRLIKE